VQAGPALLPLVPPPLPTTPLGRSLSGAYGAIVRANAANPAGAQAANFAYVQALQRARMGDVSGALAAAHIAAATAMSPGIAPQLLAPANPAPGPLPVAPARPGENSGGVFPSTAGVPIVENGVALEPDLVVARQEIDLAGQLSRRNLDGAKAHYRAALDAYVSGNAARARSEARAAFEAAADALSTVK
jgi:hypothetical protein